MTIETFTSSREMYNTSLRMSNAVRLPVKGLVKRYRATKFDDFGSRSLVIVSSTERENEKGEIKWSEASK